MKKLVAMLLILSALLCSPVLAEQEHTVAASFYPIWVLAQNLLTGIDDISLICLAAPTTGCLHDYQLLTGDIRTLHHCDALLLCGAGMEGYLSDVVSQCPQLVLIDSSTGIDLLPSESGETEFNAHLWLDPMNAEQMVKNMAEGLTVLFPEQEETITANLNIYCGKLEKLDSDIREQLSSVSRRDMITFHEAFPYFARAYGLHVPAVVALEPEESISPRMLSELVKTVKEYQNPPLFVEPQYGTSPAETVSRETGAPIFELDPLVTGDGTPESYIEGMYKNLEVLLEALN